MLVSQSHNTPALTLSHNTPSLTQLPHTLSHNFAAVSHTTPQHPLPPSFTLPPHSLTTPPHPLSHYPHTLLHNIPTPSALHPTPWTLHLHSLPRSYCLPISLTCLSLGVCIRRALSEYDVGWYPPPPPEEAKETENKLVLQREGVCDCLFDKFVLLKPRALSEKVVCWSPPPPEEAHARVHQILATRSFVTLCVCAHVLV